MHYFPYVPALWLRDNCVHVGGGGTLYKLSQIIIQSCILSQIIIQCFLFQISVRSVHLVPQYEHLTQSLYCINVSMFYRCQSKVNLQDRGVGGVGGGGGGGVVSVCVGGGLILLILAPTISLVHINGIHCMCKQCELTGSTVDLCVKGLGLTNSTFGYCTIVYHTITAIIQYGCCCGCPNMDVILCEVLFLEH